MKYFDIFEWLNIKRPNRNDKRILKGKNKQIIFEGGICLLLFAVIRGLGNCF